MGYLWPEGPVGSHLHGVNIGCVDVEWLVVADHGDVPTWAWPHLHLHDGLPLIGHAHYGWALLNHLPWHSRPELSVGHHWASDHAPYEARLLLAYHDSLGNHVGPLWPGHHPVAHAAVWQGHDGAVGDDGTPRRHLDRLGTIVAERIHQIDVGVRHNGPALLGTVGSHAIGALDHDGTLLPSLITRRHNSPDRDAVGDDTRDRSALSCHGWSDLLLLACGHGDNVAPLSHGHGPGSH